jgi:hypothetical protein
MSERDQQAELAELVQEQIHEMTDAERSALSPEYRAVVARLGVLVARGPVNARRKAHSETIIDAELARLVDDRAATVAEGDAVKSLLAGSGLRPAARRLGISHQGLANRAFRILGASASAVVASFAHSRGLAIRERIYRLTGTERVQIPAVALLELVAASGPSPGGAGDRPAVARSTAETAPK